MTRNDTPQPAGSSELWAAYEGQKYKEKELRQRWRELSERFQRAADHSSSAYERSRKAYEAYTAVQARRAALYNAAIEAGRKDVTAAGCRLAA